MAHRTRQQRAADAASRLRPLTSEEQAQLRVMVLPYVSVSLLLQGLMLAAGVRIVRETVKARRLGLSPLRRAVAGPLLALLGLDLAQILIDRRLRTSVRSLMK